MSDRITSERARAQADVANGHPIAKWLYLLADQMDADAALLADLKTNAEFSAQVIAGQDATIARLQEQVDGLMSGKYNAVVTHEEQS